MTVMCRRCGREIIPHGRDSWTHLGADGGLSVGCRAASFNPGSGWNDSLSRSWKATPPKGTTVDDVPRVLTEAERTRAMVVAMTVRNELERIHGGGNELDRTDDGGTDDGLTDEQMMHINRIVRDGVATALYAIAHYSSDDGCRRFVNFQSRMIPDYWEEPQLLAGLTELAQRSSDEGSA
jgi:hypothetical protein